MRTYNHSLIPHRAVGKSGPLLLLPLSMSTFPFPPLSTRSASHCLAGETNQATTQRRRPLAQSGLRRPRPKIRRQARKNRRPSLASHLSQSTAPPPVPRTLLFPPPRLQPGSLGLCPRPVDFCCSALPTSRGPTDPLDFFGLGAFALYAWCT